MEKKKDGRGGARVGAGRPKGTFDGETKKLKRFLSYRVNDEEKEYLENIFSKYKQKHKLTSTKAIFKIFDTIKEIEKF